MIFTLSILSTAALAAPLSPTAALKNAHQSSLDAFGRKLNGSPYKDFILASYAEPLLRKIDHSWTLAYIQNDASLFLKEYSDLITTQTEQLIIDMSNRYQECRYNSLEKRRHWEISSKLAKYASGNGREDLADNTFDPNFEGLADTGRDAELGAEIEQMQADLFGAEDRSWTGFHGDRSPIQDVNNEKKYAEVSTQTESHDTVVAKFNAAIQSTKDLFSTVLRKTGCVKAVSVLGYVLIGSVLLGYILTFIMFGVKFAKYLLSNTTQ